MAKSDTEWTCSWVTEIWADDPIDAASIAEDVVADRLSEGRHWVVENRTTGEVYDVDLEKGRLALRST